MIQSGQLDTFVTYGFVTAERIDEFQFTTPFGAERYSILMRQHKHSMYTYFVALLAGIEPIVGVLLLAALFIILCIAYFNEQRILHIFNGAHTNNVFALLHLIIPGNVTWWPHQNGVTRKVLILTSGFTILLSITHYQSNLLKELLIPPPIEPVSMYDLARSVESKGTKVIFNDRSSLIEREIRNSNNTHLKAFADALKVNPPMYTTNVRTISDMISNGDALL